MTNNNGYQSSQNKFGSTIKGKNDPSGQGHGQGINSESSYLFVVNTSKQSLSNLQKSYDEYS